MSKDEMFKGSILVFILTLGFLTFYFAFSSIINYNISENNKTHLLLKKYPQCATAYNVKYCTRVLDDWENNK